MVKLGIFLWGKKLIIFAKKKGDICATGLFMTALF